MYSHFPNARGYNVCLRRSLVKYERKASMILKRMVHYTGMSSFRRFNNWRMKHQRRRTTAGQSHPSAGDGSFTHASYLSSNLVMSRPLLFWAHTSRPPIISNQSGLPVPLSGRRPRISLSTGTTGFSLPHLPLSCIAILPCCSIFP